MKYFFSHSYRPLTEVLFLFSREGDYKYYVFFVLQLFPSPYGVHFCSLDWLLAYIEVTEKELPSPYGGSFFVLSWDYEM